MAKYPDDCPVFRCVKNGKDYVARPGVNILDQALDFLMGDNEEGADIVRLDESDIPLTRAARELLAWVRQ